MTFDHMLFLALGSLATFSFVAIVAAFGKQPKPRRPRFLVQVPKFTVCEKNRDQLRTDLRADTERDYVFVETTQQESVTVMEIR